MLSGPHKIFAEGIVAGMTATEAYRAAYPKASADTARKNAARLKANEGVKSEVSRLRAAAQEKAGSAVLTLVEKRSFLARLVRAEIANLAESSDLFVSIKRGKDGTEFKLGDKLRAIELDNDLAGEGSEAEGQDALAKLLERVMK